MISSPSIKTLCTPKTQKGKDRSSLLLTAAIDIFVEKGYAGTSLSDIIKAAGGSRSSIYSAYGGKEGLFKAALQMMVDELYLAYVSQYKEGRPFEEELRIFGKIFLTQMVSKRALGCARLVFSETVRFPEIGSWFYVQGAELSYLCFAKVLENSVPLPFEELKKVSKWFIESLKGGVYFKALCSPFYSPSEAEILEDVEYCSQVAETVIRQKMSEAASSVKK